MISKRRRAYLDTLINEVTKGHLKTAKLLWDLRSPPLDFELVGFLTLKSQSSSLSFARKSLLLSMEEVANRIGTNRSTYFRLERSERNGSILLKNLKKAAEAMDCELIYAVVPRQRKLFSQILWEKLLEKSNEMVSSRRHNRGMTPHLLVSYAKRLWVTPSFRKSHTWTERLTTAAHDPQNA